MPTNCRRIAMTRRSVVAAHADDVAPGGHAVVRVAPGGDTFRVLTLSADDEDMTVLSERHFHSKKDFNG